MSSFIDILTAYWQSNGSDIKDTYSFSNFTWVLRVNIGSIWAIYFANEYKANLKACMGLIWRLHDWRCMVHCNHISYLLFLKWYFSKVVSTLIHLVTVFSGPSGCFHLDQGIFGFSAWPLLQMQLCIMSFHLISSPSSQNLCCAALISPEFYLFLIICTFLGL